MCIFDLLPTDNAGAHTDVHTRTHSLDLNEFNDHLNLHKKKYFSITKCLMIHPRELVFLHIYNLPFGLKVLPDFFRNWKNLLTPVWVRCLWLRGHNCKDACRADLTCKGFVWECASMSRGQRAAERLVIVMVKE